MAALLMFTILHFAGPGSLARAEILDRMAAVVDGRIITLSDIRREREIMIVLGDVLVTDDAILQSLVERYLLEEQMAQFPGLDVSDDEVDKRMSIIRDFRGIAPSEIRSALTLKIQRRMYLDSRYRQFIVVNNEEIRNYYEKVFVPAATAQGADVPQLEEVVDSVRENVLEEKLSRDVEMSMESLRARSNVEIF